MPKVLLDEIVDRQTDVDYVAIVDLSPIATIHKIDSSDAEYEGHEIPDEVVKDFIAAQCLVVKHGHKEFNEELDHSDKYTWIWVPLDYEEYHALFISRNSRANSKFVLTVNAYAPKLQAHYVSEAKSINRLEPGKRKG